jgi:hypothetical protein
VRIPTVPNTSSSGYILGYGSGTTIVGGRFSVRLDTAAGATLGKLRLEVSSGSVTGTNSVICDDQWHHVAVVCQANCRMSNVVLYVDGNVQQISTTTPSVLINTATNVNPVYLGNSYTALTTSTFLGAIDDVRIYDDALTAADIADLAYGSGTAPAITQQPLPQGVHLGLTNGSATFNVGVSGSPSRFQWQRNGAALPGATNQALTLSPVTAADLGSYSVAVTNDFGSVVSAPASLTWSTPPLDPLEQTVLDGGPASCAVTMPAQSTGYTYQWLRAGSPVLNATGAVVSLPAAGLSDAGLYSVWVSLAGQSATSAPAVLRVVSPPASYYARKVVEDGVTAHWRLDEVAGALVAVDQTTLHPGSYSNFLAGDLGLAGALRGEAGLATGFRGTNYIQVPYSAALHHNTAFSLEAWVNPTLTSGRRSILCSRNEFFSSGYELAINAGLFQFRTGASSSPASEFWNDLNAGTAVSATWQHVVATFDGTSKRLYLNGALVGTQVTNVFAAPVPLRLGAGRTFTSSAGDYFSGQLDEVAVYWKALSAAQVAAHYQAALSGPPISITRQNGDFILNWTGNWVLQEKFLLDGDPGSWADVFGATSPYTVPPGMGLERYFRLRSP